MFFGIYHYSDATFKISRPSTLNSGLVGHWTFDGADTNWTTNTVVDRSGNGNTGAMTNMSTSTSPAKGKIGQALNFDGVNDKVVVNHSSSINLNNAATFSLWIKALPQMQDPWANFVQKGNGGSGGGSLFFGAANNTTNVHIRVDTPSDFNRNDQISNVLDGNWHYVSVTFESGTVKMYKDGLQTGSFSYIHGSGFGNTSNVFLGSAYGSQDFLLGLIDEVRIYNRALSASEVKALYNQSASKINKTPTNILTNGLVGHWTFDGADTNWTANTVVDRSGNGNTGAMINMSTSTSPAKGKIGQALKFDGVDDYVDVGDPASEVLDFGTGNFSLAAWINVKAKSGALRIINKRDTASQKGYEMYIENGNNNLSLFISNGVNTFGNSGDSTINLRDGNWHYVVVTFDRGGNANYYTDNKIGTPRNISASGNSSISNTQDVHIGMYNTATNYFLGLIDEVRVYNRALSASEVKALYNMGR